MEENKDISILYVEDDPSLGKLFEKLLTSLNYKVDLSYDGADAIEKIKAKYYHIILLDLMLPKYSGTEVLYAINKEGLKYGKVIILTNLAWDEFAQKTKENYGVQDYLVKSNYQPQQVAEIIQKRLMELQSS